MYNVKNLRRERRMSQEELAEKSGVSRATISGLESSQEAVVTTGTLKKIALALGVSISEIFLDGLSSGLDDKEAG